MKKVSKSKLETERKRSWKTVRCSNCGGQGMNSHYSYNDFEGAEECGDCGGSGQIYQHVSGVLAEYPGGRFLGRS